eukprot:44756-Chlamydomonas_euryale.AAC.1
MGLGRLIGRINSLSCSGDSRSPVQATRGLLFRRLAVSCSGDWAHRAGPNKTMKRRHLQEGSEADRVTSWCSALLLRNAGPRQVLCTSGWMDELTDGQTDERTDRYGRMDGRMSERVEEQRCGIGCDAGSVTLVHTLAEEVASL